MMRQRLVCWLVLSLLSVGLTGTRASACYAVVVGKEASQTGAVLLGHNEQNGGLRYLNFRRIPRLRHAKSEVVELHGGAEIPQVEETWAFLWSENPGLLFSDACLNEWGVAVVSDACPDQGESLEALEAEGELVRGGITYPLRRLVVERAKTAREGVAVAAKLVSRFGYPAGRTLVIADAEEAWLLSLTRGKHFVAERVRDDQVVLLPNVYVIGEVNLADEKNFLGSPDLVEYAAKQGFYDPASGEPFLFWKAYSAKRDLMMDPRQWHGQCYVTGTEISREPDRQLPFSVKPDRLLGVSDVIALLRYHGPERICSPDTQEAAVFELRGGFPPAIGCIYWRASAEPCTSVLTPWYCGITETPKRYYKPCGIREMLSTPHHFLESYARYDLPRKNAFRIFRDLQEWVNADYGARSARVRSEWDRFEADLMRRQPAVEERALELYRKRPARACAYLTSYCRDVASRAIKKSGRLIQQR
jgi:dipeptidase